MELINLFTNHIALLITSISILAFFVSVVTEVTKNIGFLKKIPTDIQVIVLSMILCVTSYLAYVSYLLMPIYWYYVVVAIISSFLVAFVSMYGWEKFMSLYDRFKK